MITHIHFAYHYSFDKVNTSTPPFFGSDEIFAGVLRPLLK